MIFISKKEIRKEIKQKLDLYKDNFLQASEEITDKIISSLEYKNADTVLSYMSLPDEANISINRISQDKKVFIPKVNIKNTTMDFFSYTEKTKVNQGAYNILEPDEKSEIFNMQTPELYGNILALIPGRAFTCDGKRLGRGKGYYDRFLSDLINRFSEKQITIAGVCFAPQIIKDIPTDDFDIKMDIVFTNN